MALTTRILTAAAVGIAAVYLTLGAPEAADSCAAALNSTAPTRHEFQNFTEFHERWARTLESSNVREHGWELYRDVVSPATEGCPSSKVPLWLSWATKMEVFPAHGARGAQREINAIASTTLGIDRTIQRLLSEAGKPSSPGGNQVPGTGNRASSAKNAHLQPVDLNTLFPQGPFVVPGTKKRTFFSSAYYNPAAEHSALAKARDLMMAAHKSVPSEVEDPTPPEAIIVKPIWLPIQNDTLMACVPVWNPGAVPTDLGGYDSTDWPEQLRVSTAQLQPNSMETCKSGLVPTVSVDEFFHMKITSSNVNELQLAVPATIGPRLVQEGNVALLVGLHVISKEVKSWSWNTYWWEPQKYRNSGPAAGRPKLDSPWSNYVMSASLDEARNPTSEADGKCDVGAIYNPYQEVQIPPTGPLITVCGKPTGLGGLASNCRSCHSLASYIAAPVVTIQPPADWLRKYFSDKTRTGFLWSMPDWSLR
jgi:hypothetical protein